MTWGPDGSWPRGSGSFWEILCVGFTIEAGWSWVSAMGFRSWSARGLLPGGDFPCAATLAHNDSGRFEARWVKVVPRPGLSPFVTFDEPIELPVAHGEGKFLTAVPAQLDRLERNGQIVLQYACASGLPTQEYPANPNGSAAAAAGVCDPSGRIFGLMPHPERFVESWHHPALDAAGKRD